MDKSDGVPKYVSAGLLLEKLFSETLIGDDFDEEIVQLIREHLGVESPLSKAGSNLADALISLAAKRGRGDK